METLTIGQVAKKTDVGLETIRFYEREGVVSENTIELMLPSDDST